MKLYTPVELPDDLPRLSQRDQLLLMGSCFATNIGAKLTEGKFRCTVNPYGTLYNPLSISAALREIRSGKRYGADDLFFYNGCWHSPMHHSDFSSPDREETLQRINERLAPLNPPKGGTSHNTNSNISSPFGGVEGAIGGIEGGCSFLLLTWGTAWVYEDKATGKVVGNCHKQPDRCFTRRMLTVEEIVEDYTELIERSLFPLTPSPVDCPPPMNGGARRGWGSNDTLSKSYTNSNKSPLPTGLLSPDKRGSQEGVGQGVRLLLTVSPIRHLKDGLHGNQLSKATLLLAAAELQNRFPKQLFYFPAYELLMDELRDYRFYAEDMLHPSQVAVDYVWERFAQTCLTDEARQTMQACEEIHKALAHKPFRPDSEEYKHFLGQIVLKIDQLNEKCPTLDLQNERDLCRIRLKASQK